MVRADPQWNKRTPAKLNCFTWWTRWLYSSFVCCCLAFSPHFFSLCLFRTSLNRRTMAGRPWPRSSLVWNTTLPATKNSAAKCLIGSRLNITHDKLLPYEPAGPRWRLLTSRQMAHCKWKTILGCSFHFAIYHTFQTPGSDVGVGIFHTLRVQGRMTMTCHAFFCLLVFSPAKQLVNLQKTILRWSTSWFILIYRYALWVA